MKKCRFTEEQIIGFIKQAAASMRIEVLCRKGGFCDATFSKWRAKYGGMDVLDTKRLRELKGAWRVRMRADASVIGASTTCQAGC